MTVSRRTVSRRIREQRRCFKSGYEALVAVGCGIGESVDGTGVLDNAADVVERLLRKVGIVIASEYRFVALPDRLMRVHSRAVVVDDRLRHDDRVFCDGSLGT